jgi:hypothetical protein
MPILVTSAACGDGKPRSNVPSLGRISPQPAAHHFSLYFWQWGQGNGSEGSSGNSGKYGAIAGLFIAPMIPIIPRHLLTCVWPGGGVGTGNLSLGLLLGTNSLSLFPLVSSPGSAAP